MKIVVCIRQSADGEINPFDASAYETALRIGGAEITLLSMGPEKTADFLENLTRLGAKEAVLLTDKAFAGADTLATSYTLSLGIKRLKPDLIICGRQSVDGDTGQVGPSLSVNTGYSLLTNIMSVVSCEKKITGINRRTFFNWKYMCCRIPEWAKSAMERVAGQSIFVDRHTMNQRYERITADL